MSDWMRQVIESKRACRAKLASLPFEEKIALLEQLKERSLSIGAARPKEQPLPTSVHDAGTLH